MKKNEVVWRTLADAALEGQREWPDLRALSASADVPVSTAHQATQRLVEIGAISTQHRGGITVMSPEKLLTYLAARRSLTADLAARTTIEEAQKILDRSPAAASLGGPDAAVHWLGGTNNVADKGVRILYVDEKAIPEQLHQGNEMLLLKRDSVAAVGWVSGFSSRAQTYADLFALPGWQASEFRQALHHKFFAASGWDQSSGVDA